MPGWVYLLHRFTPCFFKSKHLSPLIFMKAQSQEIFYFLITENPFSSVTVHASDLHVKGIVQPFELGLSRFIQKLVYLVMYIVYLPKSFPNKRYYYYYIIIIIIL